MSRIVIAIGGNAISSSSSLSSFESESNKIKATLKGIAKLYAEGNKVVVTHGNGPQVGSELERNEIAARKIPELPLYYLTAETQSVMGSAIEMALRRALHAVGKNPNVCTLISHVIVDKGDKAFDKPTKPIGPFMNHAELKRELKHITFAYIKKKDKYRRIVSSPKPLKVLESGAIKELSDHQIVVCCGGGGIPISRNNSRYKGADAVIDKDLTTSLIANEIKAERLIILTDIDYLYTDIDCKKGAIKEIKLKAVKKLMNRLEDGTIKPKVLACISFLDNGGKEAYIGNVYKLTEILNRDSGTRIR